MMECMPNALQAPPITVEQYEQFEGFPGRKHELINEHIVISPAPKPLHQQVAQSVHDLLRHALQQQPYTVRKNSNIRFRDQNSMPAPDVFVVTKEQWNRACDTDAYLLEAPFLVVEVLWPANRKRRVEEKVEIYLCQGVKEVWLVDPKRQTVQVARAGGRNSAVAASLPLPEPLSGTLEVAAMFARDL